MKPWKMALRILRDSLANDKFATWWDRGYTVELRCADDGLHRIEFAHPNGTVFTVLVNGDAFLSYGRRPHHNVVADDEAAKAEMIFWLWKASGN